MAEVSGEQASLGTPQTAEQQDGLAEHIRQQLDDFRRKLLDPSLRNPLLSFSFREPSTSLVRIVDELPDPVFEQLEGGGEFVIRALDPPRTEPEDEETESFQAALARFKAEDPVYREASEALRRRRAGRLAQAELERRARDRVRFELGMEPWEAETGLSPDELARRRGLNPDFDLPEPDPDTVLDRHHDDDLQTLLPAEKLDAKLRGLRERARSSVREMGVPTLFAAFGFLEWYEDEASERAHFAPLVLLPLEINRRREGQRYRYFVGALDQNAAANLTLELMLRERFGLVLPPFEDDDTPETYFHKVRVMCDEKPRWQVRRFLTLGVFPFSKIAIYEDLDLDARWPSPDAVVGHHSIRNLVASAGDADSPFGDEYPLDDPEIEPTVPPLIYDADSSQHSAMIDVMAGKDLAIHGPPGTGKSQTITNIIAAVLAAGNSVLFVAEKMAALDVVADRLNKAGLGNFCLNLHRNVKKAAVLGDFKQRLEMPAPQFDATTYEQDREQWRAQRDTLKRYSELVNETVGNLNVSVHEVLWRATEAQTWLGEIPAQLHSLTLPEARLLQPRDVQAARASLSTLEPRFETARQVVPDMADHPWRGCERQGLTPMEIASATNYAEAWRQALDDMESLVRALLGKATSEREFGALRDVIRRLQGFPDPPRPGWIENHGQAANGEFRCAVLEFAVRVQRAKDIASELATAFAPGVVGKLDTDELDAIIEEAKALGIVNETPDAVAEELSKIRQGERDWETVRSGLQRLLELFGIEDFSGTAVSQALAAAKLIEDTDRNLLLARTEPLVEETNGQLLRSAAKRFEGLRAQRDELAHGYHLASVPEARTLRQLAVALREVGLFAAFGRDFKEARRTFRAISRSAMKQKPAEMAAEFERLASFRELETALREDERLNVILGTGRIEADIDLDLALSVNAWAGEVVSAFPGLDAVRDRVRNVILNGDIAVLDEIRTGYEGIVARAPFVSVMEEGLSYEDIESRLRAESERADGHHDFVQRIEAVSFRADRSIGDLERLRNSVVERDHIADLVNHCDEARQWLGEDFAGVETNLSPIADELDYLGRLEDLGLSDDVCEAAFKRTLEQAEGVAALKRELQAGLDQVDETWCALCDVAAMDERAFFAPSRSDTLRLAELANRGSRCAGDGQALSTWQAFQLARSTALATPARTVLQTLERNDLPLIDLIRAFDFVLYRGLANDVYHDYPDLQRVSGQQLQDSRKALAELDEQLLDLERRKIAHELFRRRVEPGVGIGRPGDYTERALIQHNVSLQRSPLPLRNLLLRAATAARQLKPCFMMSPITVAQYLPKAPELFDVVIIDEASQMRPEDAFGAVARARQCVIVGDPMQLPPTSFFETAFWTQTDEDDADDRLYEQVDSILDLALRAFRPTRYLRWHYRSLHSGLIQFSNHHFYDDKLVIFPAANENDSELGVRFEAVNGIYEAKRNVDEAQAVVDAAMAFMKSPRTRNLSLGVVAINQSQRDLLSELFDQAFAQDSRAEGYRRKWDATLHPFFVKNLENVQGDERDAIFISMVYGPDRSSGRVANRFGPINRPGGHRRLNVLFTRARRQVRVFSSMSAGDVLASDRSSAGVGILKAYLEYAATGRLHTGAIGDAATESPFEDFVKSRLEAHGFEAVPQVGVAGYRIDLGVRHPAHPHGFLLGIECDGATYHAAKSVRDRDRLRQMILEGLGWEIYRIWSTDWFEDPEREFGRLLGHLQSMISPAAIETDSGLTATGRRDAGALPGFVVDTGPERSTTQEVTAGDVGRDGEHHLELFALTDPGASADDAPEIVEIGDLVDYAHADGNGTVRQVRIVSGPDDPDQGIINDAKPLSIALLGCSVGERTTVEQPTSTIDVVVMRIDRPSEADRPGPPARASLNGGVAGLSNDSESPDLAPYSAWSGGRLPDPRHADHSIVAKVLYEIIEAEGPVLVGRVYRLYARACGLQRVGRQIQASLNKALAGLLRDKRVSVENEDKQPGLINGIVRPAGSDRVRLRERGPRTFEEIPPLELASHLKSIREELVDLGEEELGRELLDRYGLVRMTRQVRSTLSSIYRDHLS